MVGKPAHASCFLTPSYYSAQILQNPDVVYGSCAEVGRNDATLLMSSSPSLCLWDICSKCHILKKLW